MKLKIILLIIPLAILSWAKTTSASENNDPIVCPEMSPDSFSKDCPTLNDEGIWWSITGYVYKNEAMTIPFPDVTVSFSGIGSAQTNENGYYIFDVPQNWSGTAEPSFCNPFYEFDPPQRAYYNVKKNFTQQNYWGEPTQMFTISGTFTHSQTGEPLANTEVNFENGITVTTSETGVYSIEVLPCYSDTLKPVSDSWNFTPEFRVYENLSANISGQDYSFIQKSFGLPPGWNYINTGSVHIISIFSNSNPTLCGTQLQQGDYIGVFYVGDDGELHCAGAGEWTGISNTPIMANGDDIYTIEKDGFDYGEIMNWKIFTWTGDQKEYPAYPDYQTGGYLVGDNKWYSGGLSIVDEMNCYKTQEIFIPEGWSGISGYYIPMSNNLVQTMSPIVNELVIMQTLTKMYYPAQNINTIGIWNVNDGYKIKVTQNVALPLIGCPLTSRSKTLVPTWNIIPVKSECNVSVQQLFDPVLNSLIVVKEIAGNNIYWPSMSINTLQTLVPGKAYMVAVSQSATITYPECSTQKSDLSNKNTIFFNNTYWPDPVVAPSSHLIAISGTISDIFEIGDYIGAFTPDGICAGLTEINQKAATIGITVSGNDPTSSETTGFSEGEMITFKLFKTATGKEFDLIAEYDLTMPSSDGTFTENGLSKIIGLALNPTGINLLNEAQYPQIFPNPTSGVIHLIAPDERYRITLFNGYGNPVLEEILTGTSSIDVSYLRKGLYFLKIEGQTFLNNEKLILK